MNRMFDVLGTDYKSCISCDQRSSCPGYELTEIIMREALIAVSKEFGKLEFKKALGYLLVLAMSEKDARMNYLLCTTIACVLELFEDKIIPESCTLEEAKSFLAKLQKYSLEKTVNELHRN